MSLMKTLFAMRENEQIIRLEILILFHIEHEALKTNLEFQKFRLKIKFALLFVYFHLHLSKFPSKL